MASVAENKDDMEELEEAESGEYSETGSSSGEEDSSRVEDGGAPREDEGAPGEGNGAPGEGKGEDRDSPMVEDKGAPRGEDGGSSREDGELSSSEEEEDQEPGGLGATAQEKSGQEGIQLSKRKQKRLKKQEKAMKYRAEKRMKERAHKKMRKRERREAGEDVGPSKKLLKMNKMVDSDCKIRVAIDCDFDNLMSEKDIMKLTSQLGYSYSSNRRAENPLQYYVTSLGGQTKTRMDRIGDYSNWDVNFTEKSYTEQFDRDSIVYLSSDSDNVLERLDPEKVYIIGGLVDHNHHKGLCHRLAVEKGVNHARLPIGKFIAMNSRSVLTINHVFDILLKFTETNSWEEAFFQVLPKRKGAKSRRTRGATSSGAASKPTTNHTEHNPNTTGDTQSTEKSTENTENIGKGEKIAFLGAWIFHGEKENPSR